MGSDINRRIIGMIINGDINSRSQLQKVKVKMAGEYGLNAVPSNSEILADAHDDELRTIIPMLQRKPVRTISGVAVVAVMTSPHPCPHGKCTYCPGGVDNGSPQSYTGKEPAARRALRNEFDPFRQVSDRINQLEAIGHRTDKIDLIIMGGTFTSRDPQYQEWFVRRCFDAMNGKDSKSMDEAHALNTVSAHRCIGMTVETRPDVFGDEEIERTMALGATRAEIGVQILDDDILRDVNRGHGTKEIIDATGRCKRHGLKVCYHVMPGLPGSSAEKDIVSFKRMFEDPGMRPDMLKIYPTLVIPGTELHDRWLSGGYVPYNDEQGTELISQMKLLVPEYIRIQRIQRDIPVQQIAAGIMKSNLRELAQRRLSEQGKGCRCIRCREVGQNDISLDDPSAIVLNDMRYEASGGTEHFVSLEYDDMIIGYVRLRTDGDIASIRELKVFGRMAAIGEQGEDWQHRGFGKQLMARAEEIAASAHAREIRITSGVGVRRYYASLGYELRGPYMVKEISG
ncbi:MAG: tRNA uridine(34) 5-carboxymethylaminomethyl modification radical SAM/GNAT enzyme Elp3 [Methanomassiliicoccaceae archaeon]|jgi:elongator complex protein 3|nr:tRNA uridine(34) 5-carboxymethylaminomethyl modification radical SAM/GNAT enzyme Elp3 [Methanomassiliicoccaceae archaeon]